MDLAIKAEPDLFDSISQSAEFLDEKPSEQNTKKINETSVNGNPEQTVSEQIKVVGSKKGGRLSPHRRKRLLKAFQEDGCSPETIAKYAIAYDLNIETIYDYFNNAAQEAQHYVHEECDSLSFNNITEWLKYLKVLEVHKHCNYEAAIVLNAIAKDEFHPEPESLHGIDLRGIYKFLSNALKGLPQQQLDETSAKFLSNEFQNLINEANTDAADNDVRDMKRKIESSLMRTINGKYLKLDPLNTNNEEIEKCYEIAKCKTKRSNGMAFKI